MIVLDTNVLSEFMRGLPEPKVEAWLRTLPATSVFTTSISQAEIHYGVELLSPGKRRILLEQAATKLFQVVFAGRVLSFGSEAAVLYGKIASGRRASGKPISQSDAQIAAIALASGARLATRNGPDFEDCGLEIINPWTAD